MRSQSKFEVDGKLKGSIEQAAYGVMDQIKSAKEVRVLQVGPNEEWVIVEYDWLSEETNYDATEALKMYGLRKADLTEKVAQDRLR